jgi:hypothetical protein
MLALILVQVSPLKAQLSGRGHEVASLQGRAMWGAGVT